MYLAHDPRRRTVHYQDWAGHIQAAIDHEELVKVVRDYLGIWRADQLNILPADIGATALEECDDIVSRALLATQAELKFSGSEEDHALLREMAVTFAAAASRLRFLKSSRWRKV